MARFARGVPVTSSLQFEADQRKPVKFGRIGWNPEGQAKWTHRADPPYRFLSTEVWAPSRGACTQDRNPPDFLFLLRNQGYFAKEITFRNTVLLAVPQASAEAVQECARVTGELAGIMQAKFHGRMTRPWARPFGRAMFTDSLGDLPISGLFRVGPVHKETPGNEILAEHWEPVPSSPV